MHPRPLVAAAFLLAATPALATEPAYVGTWGVSAVQCKIRQDRQGAPMVIRAKGYDQNEAHCNFTSVKKLALHGASPQPARSRATNRKTRSPSKSSMMRWC